MDKKISRKPYSPAFRERAVRLFVEHRPEYPGEVAALPALAEKPGCSPDSLRPWAHQARRDAGEGPGPTGAEKARIKELERENRELREGEEDQERSGGPFPRGRRSAACCRSPRRGTIGAPSRPASRTAPRPARSPTPRCASRSGGSGGEPPALWRP